MAVPPSSPGRAGREQAGAPQPASLYSCKLAEAAYRWVGGWAWGRVRAGVCGWPPGLRSSAAAALAPCAAARDADRSGTTRALCRCGEQALQLLAATSPQLSEAQLQQPGPAWPRRLALVALCEQLAALEESLQPPTSQVAAARDAQLAAGLRSVVVRLLRAAEPLLAALTSGREPGHERLTDRARTLMLRVAE